MVSGGADNPEDFHPEDFGRYTCPICGQPHDTPGDKKRHMRESHGEAKK